MTTTTIKARWLDLRPNLPVTGSYWVAVTEQLSKDGVTPPECASDQQVLDAIDRLSNPNLCN